MRFTSLIVELVRARPRLIFWLVTLAIAALWFVLPLLFYRSPPGEVADVLALGREYQVGTMRGPPFAYWLADIAFRLAGGHMIGVYLLAQVCYVVAFWALFRLARAIVGGPQAVLAVLLTATVFAFSFPGIAFGPQVLARPLWALVLMHGWEVIGRGRRDAWFALSIEIGLLLLTAPATILLVALLAGFALATERGRRALASADTLFAALVVVVLVVPYLVWMLRAGVDPLAPLPSLADWQERLSAWGWMLAWLVIEIAGIVVLALLDARPFNRKPDDAPTIWRPPLDPFARRLVYVVALVPAPILTLLAALWGADRILIGNGVALLPIGLAAVVAAGDVIYLRRQDILRAAWFALVAAPAVFVLGTIVIRPWMADEVRTSLPAAEIGSFFGDSFQRRTGRPLAAVAGDPELAALVGFAALSRPHVLGIAPGLTPARFAETGGVVVWRAADTAGTPPDTLQRQFPGLVPEVPRAFDVLVRGRLPPLRIGWAVVRPQR